MRAEVGGWAESWNLTLIHGAGFLEIEENESRLAYRCWGYGKHPHERTKARRNSPGQRNACSRRLGEGKQVHRHPDSLPYGNVPSVIGLAWAALGGQEPAPPRVRVTKDGTKVVCTPFATSGILTGR